MAGLQAGFKPNPEMAYTGSAEISDEQVGMILELALGADAREDEALHAAVRRTDGQARQLMIEAVIAGQGSNLRALVATSSVPVAIVNGENDPSLISIISTRFPSPMYGLENQSALLTLGTVSTVNGPSNSTRSFWRLCMRSTRHVRLHATTSAARDHA
ncbi:hypothetical protein [Rhizobium leguminosarum]|uniref:hypothetical protein n=1 Tax=Rhizobium leguminosarum TaxID=384 RepID=UPI0024A7C7F8|nr:hypothetical protein [Rhizobium leguminosarum]MDI5929413.1 hypothetical protein [Rhizobium leguminosarum]